MKEPLRPRRETFVVRVLCRQNSTWQGEVMWAEENKRQYFRSALELMELMDSAVEGKEEERTRRSWDEAQEPEVRGEPVVSGD